MFSKSSRAAASFVVRPVRRHVPCITALQKPTHQPYGTIRIRSFSSRSGNQRRGPFQLDALPFSVSPESALQTFRKWAVDEQGLNWLVSWNSLQITAAYVPVWTFDVNVRFVTVDEATGRRRFDWKPTSFAPYGQQSVVHVPGLSAYAGHSYRRSLVNPVHNTTLVFLGDQTVPFGKWMLRDMEFSNGETLSIYPDPWNATRGRALQVVQEELQGIAMAENENVKVQMEVLRSRRVYMPTFVIDYKVLGSEYCAFVSGCDAGAGVSGISHTVFDPTSTQEMGQASTSFLSQAWRAAQTGANVMGPRQFGSMIVVLMQLFGNLAARLLLRIPVITLVSGAFVGFRKIVQPWMDNRWASADWERQRDHESVMDDRFDHVDDFADSGSAKRYFQSNRGRILRHLSGEQEHAQGEYDWYKKWEEWARHQWEQQQQQQSSQQTHQQSQQQQRQQRPRSQQKPKPDYRWDFNPNDPYSVLKIQRGATKTQVSAAFRKEMLKHHPDTQSGASEAEKARSLERSKYITDAYRKIKADMK